MEPIEPHRCQPEENAMNPEYTIMLFGLPELMKCLAEGSEAEQLSALTIAMRRGADGLALVIGALKSPNEVIQKAAVEHLIDCTEGAALEALWQYVALPGCRDRAHYQALQESLVHQQWQVADDLTIALIKAIADRSDRWLRQQDLSDFPRADLRVIDRLWCLYSRNRFGFSIQAKIWRDCTAETCKPMSYDRYNLCHQFADQLGWKVVTYTGWHVPEYDFKRRAKVPYDLNAPIGHLPSTFALGGGDSQQDYNPPDTESTMGFYGSGYYYYTWSNDSLVGHAFLRDFFSIFEADSSDINSQSTN